MIIVFSFVTEPRNSIAGAALILLGVPLYWWMRHSQRTTSCPRNPNSARTSSPTRPPVSASPTPSATSRSAPSWKSAPATAPSPPSSPRAARTFTASSSTLPSPASSRSSSATTRASPSTTPTSSSSTSPRFSPRTENRERTTPSTSSATCPTTSPPTSSSTSTKLARANLLRRAVLMMQREVADRITAHPGVSDYGALSAFTQLHAHATPIFHTPTLSLLTAAGRLLHRHPPRLRPTLR